MFACLHYKIARAKVSYHLAPISKPPIAPAYALMPGGFGNSRQKPNVFALVPSVLKHERERVCLSRPPGCTRCYHCIAATRVHSPVGKSMGAAYSHPCPFCALDQVLIIGFYSHRCSPLFYPDDCMPMMSYDIPPGIVKHRKHTICYTKQLSPCPI